MIEWFTEPFALGFQQRALIGGILAGLMCSAVGTWLVLRGMSFFGDAFTHGVLPGIAAAVALQFNVLLGAALAAAVMLALIEVVNRNSRLSEDTAIGLLFVGMLALGVVIISKVDSYTGSLTSILFGDALGVTSADLVWQVLLGALVILASIVLYRPLLALSFNESKAELLGLHPRAAHAALLTLIAAAVIGSFQAVGTLLVFGLLVGPPATAALLARTVPRMMLTAAALSVFSVWLGLLLSYHLGTAASASMALVPIVLFFLVLPAAKHVHARRQARDATAAATPVDGGAGMSSSAGRPGEPAEPADPAEGPWVVSAQGVELHYGSYVALAASSFQAPNVGVVSVIGPNGSGKSTLLSALAGLVPVALGQLRVLGQEPAAARSRLSYVMQATPVPRVTPITVREIVGLGRLAALGMFGRFRAPDREAVTAAMSQMAITDLAGRHMHELSGGQRQRVLIAQGLVQEHDLLILDEPLTGLDLTSAATIDHLIHEQRNYGHTVILTTHDLDEARAADWVILVNRRVVASGPPEQVCNRRNLEVAYGLGGTHDWDGFIDDPAHDTHWH